MIKKLLKRNSIFSTSAGILICIFLLTACSKDQSAVSTPAPAKPQKAAVVVPKPVQKSASSASRLPPPLEKQFDFNNKKDPFKPFVVAKVETKRTFDALKKEHDSLPIHSFDVSQFQLIGIVTGGRENRAMVVDPGKKGYVLKVGMTIGKNDGKIIAINTNGVDVVEQFRDESGKTRKETIKLTLPRKQ